jgi:predicted small lipoprotein YifL
MRTAGLLLSAIISVSIAQIIVSETCAVVGSSMPVSGSCGGPTERAFVKLTNAATLTGCGANQVQYFPDDNPNAEPKCGECVPGTSGVEDPELLCELNEYCNDDAICVSTKSSPLYNEPCPYEQGWS